MMRNSALNPSNWFGRGASEQIGTTGDAAPVNPLIPTGSGLFDSLTANPDKDVYLGRPFGEITNLTVERVAGGAVIRATGLAARQGIHTVRLTPEVEDEIPVDGVLTYRLEGIEPVRPTAVGAPATREVTAARKLTDQQLRGVRSIRVEGLSNAQVARR